MVRGLVLAGLVLIAVGFVAARSAEGSAPQAERAAVVQPGDTIWSIASHQYPDSDPRARVGQIERLNHRDGPAVHPGDRLELPAG